MFSNISISSIDAFSCEEKSPFHNEDRSLTNEVAAPLSEVKCDDQREISRIVDDDASDTSELSSFLAADELEEDNPPLMSVQGFRPGDYTITDFYPGVHIQYARRKQGPWLEGLVVRTEEDDITLLMEIRHGL